MVQQHLLDLIPRSTSVPSFFRLDAFMLPLTVNAIHIWTWATTATPSASFSHDLLDEEECKRLDSYRFEEDKLRFCWRHQRLRHLLGHYTGRDPGSLRFTYNAHGKPRLLISPLTPDIHFNLSFSRQWNGLAIRLNHPVGLDIEDMDERCNFLSLAKSCFAPTELAQIKDAPLEQQQAIFFKIWTLKEAFVKACGLGLALPLKSFAVQVTKPGELVDGPTQYTKKKWQFDQWALAPASCMSLCLPLGFQQPALQILLSTVEESFPGQMLA